MCSWSPETCCSQRLQLCDVWKRGAAFPAAWCTAAAKVTVGQFCHVDNFAPPGSHRQRSHTWPYCAVSENSGRRSRLAGLPIFSNFWAEKFYTDFSVSSGSLLHQSPETFWGSCSGLSVAARGLYLFCAACMTRTIIMKYRRLLWCAESTSI